MYEDIPYDNTSPLYDPVAAMFDEKDDDDDEGFLMLRIARRHRLDHRRSRGLDDEILRMDRFHRQPEKLYSPEHGSHRYTEGIHNTQTGPVVKTGSVDEYL